MVALRRPACVSAIALAAACAVVAVPAAPCSAQNGDFSKAKLTGVYPAGLKVNPAAGTLKVLVTGTGLSIASPEGATGYSGDSFAWDARQTVVYVRHSARGPVWQALFNSYRDWNTLPASYPNAPAEVGSHEFQPFGNCYMTRYLELSLPASVWATADGILEIKVSKGKWGGNVSFSKDSAAESPSMGEFGLARMSESNVVQIPVKKTVGAINAISAVSPEYFVVGEAPVPNLSVAGVWGPGTVILLDGVPLETSCGFDPPGHLLAPFPPHLLSKPGVHTLMLRDVQNAASETASVWVYGPPQGMSTQPKVLMVGPEARNVDVRFTGLAPKSVEGRVGYIVDVARPAATGPAASANPGQFAAPPRPAPGAQVTPAAATGPWRGSHRRQRGRRQCIGWGPAARGATDLDATVGEADRQRPHPRGGARGVAEAEGFAEAQAGERCRGLRVDASRCGPTPTTRRHPRHRCVQWSRVGSAFPSRSRPSGSRRIRRGF